MTKPFSLLVIDDEIDMLNSTCKILESAGYLTTKINDTSTLPTTINNNKYDLILSDLLMPEMDGKQVIDYIKNKLPNVPVIIFSAYGTVDRAVSCMKAGAYDFIEKPFEAEHLLLVVKRALSYVSLYNERNELKNRLRAHKSFENIIGKSEQMLKIFDMIEDIAKTDANILITGESGTGKELIARCIHEKSNRRKNKFIPINCSALPDNLFESEIFGYEKGAFTGALMNKIGLLELANEGTFFFDEIGDLSKSSQTKLLRALQERKIRRLGGNNFINLNVRFISATNKTIEELSKEHKIREDLYYRINVINIHIPPLRERKNDIQLLAEHFLDLKSEKMGKDIKGFTDEVIKYLENYNWPGNVRELENIIERAVALCKGDIIRKNNLPFDLVVSEHNSTDFRSKSLRDVRLAALEKVDRDYLYFLMKKYKANITKISKHSNMSRRNLYNLLKKYDINPKIWRDDKY